MGALLAGALRSLGKEDGEEGVALPVPPRFAIRAVPTAERNLGFRANEIQREGRRKLGAVHVHRRLTATPKRNFENESTTTGTHGGRRRARIPSHDHAQQPVRSPRAEVTRECRSNRPEHHSTTSRERSAGLTLHRSARPNPAGAGSAHVAETGIQAPSQQARRALNARARALPHPRSGTLGNRGGRK